MSDYEILGLKTDASKDDVIKAYRKLAMKYHPDREGGDEKKFQEMKAAFEAIEKANFIYLKPAPSDFAQGFRRQQNWEKPAAPGGTWRDGMGDAFKRYDRNNYEDIDIETIYKDLRSSRRGPPGFKDIKDPPPDYTGYGKPDYSKAQDGSEIVARVSLREAFRGFNMIVPGRYGKMPSSVNIPPGMPDGHRRTYPTTNGGTEKIIVKIETGDFHLRGFDDAHNLFSAGLNIGDVELDLDVNALDIITGGWVEVNDFLGEKLSVRIPPGFNPLHRLKVAGKGYYGWLQEFSRPANYRMDMFLKIRPIFSKPQDIEKEKIINLYNTIKDL